MTLRLGNAMIKDTTYKEGIAITATDRLLSAILDIGESMLEAGAEVSRVEGTIQRLTRAYGFTDVQVFSILFSIVVTVVDQDDNVVTHTRRIDNWSTNLHRIEQLNALSRRLCAAPAPAEEITAAVARIRSGPRYPAWVRFALFLFNPLVLTLFFGGTLWDALASSACGAILWGVDRLGQRLEIRSLVHSFFCAITVGLSTAICAAIFPALHLDKVIIGNIMLLIPGLSLTVALRDMINGDIITGLLSFSEAILRAVIIAVGVALAPALLGGLI